jgi:hypothetical protein
MKRITIIAVVSGLGLGGLIGALALSGWPLPGQGSATVTPAHPVFSEVQWPYPADEWGKGKAFRCEAANCGVEVNLFVRAKIGFCNCKTGVSDDTELDRVGDFRLMGEQPSALAPGHQINVAWMKGRSRAYGIASPFRTRNSALAVAFNDRCDVIVATAVVAHDQPGAIEPGVIEFLNSDTIVHWAEITLGL